MDDYISREDAVQCAVDIAADFFNDGSYSASGGANTVGVWLKDLPAADVRPVVLGKWIKLDMHRSMEQYKCSACRSECYVPECMGEPMYDFCPHCGADMREPNLDATKGERRDESRG